MFLRKSYSSLDVEAMFAEANMLPCYYRQGYDIALPLPPRKKFLDIKSTPSLRRKYFATFKVNKLERIQVGRKQKVAN